jgi:hypothetical protein
MPGFDFGRNKNYMGKNTKEKRGKMKKALALVTAVLLFSGTVFANPYEDFNKVLDSSKISKSRAQRYLDALANDVGQAIAAGSFGIGSSLGLLGLYTSLKVSYQQISSDDVIIEKAGYSGLAYPVLQIEIGLPFRVDAIVRGSYFYDSTLLGGGLRWEAVQGRELIIPTVSVQSVYNSLQVDASGNKFNAWNLKTAVSAYFGEIPIFKPYVFATFDHTNLDAKSSDYSALSSNMNGFGYGLGGSVNLGIIDFSFSVSMYEDTPNYNFNVFLGI